MYIEASADSKHFYLHPTTIDQINEYTQRVRTGQVRCNLPPCPHCEKTSNFFTRHEARQRYFYAIVEQMVRKILGLLIRWKCPGCGKTFTDYPGFALPFKRYILSAIMKYSSQYTENDQTTYRKIIQNNPSGYPESECQLDHSTIHRWLGTLGSFTQTIRKAQDLILQSRPDSSICRDLAGLSIPSKKYHKKERAGVLLRCRQLFSLEGLYRSIFKVSIFPNLATGCSFG